MQPPQPAADRIECAVCVAGRLCRNGLHTASGDWTSPCIIRQAACKGSNSASLKAQSTSDCFGKICQQVLGLPSSVSHSAARSVYESAGVDSEYPSGPNAEEWARGSCMPCALTGLDNALAERVVAGGPLAGVQSFVRQCSSINTLRIALVGILVRCRV